MKKLTLLSLLLTAACASAQYRHPSKTKQQFYQDKTNCRAKAGQAIPAGEDRMSHVFNFDTKRDDFVAECMEGEGWTKE